MFYKYVALALLAPRTVNLNQLVYVVFGDALLYGLKPNEQRSLKGSSGADIGK